MKSGIKWRDEFGKAVEEKGERMTLVNCDYCGGTGVCPDEEYEPADCDMCEGTGCVEKELDGCVCAESP